MYCSHSGDIKGNLVILLDDLHQRLTNRVAQCQFVEHIRVRPCKIRDDQGIVDNMLDYFNNIPEDSEYLFYRYDEYKEKGVEIVSLAVRDTPDKVRKYTQDVGMNWVQLMGTRPMMSAFGRISGVPTNIWIDKDGNEVMRTSGLRSYADIKKAFEAIL